MKRQTILRTAAALGAACLVFFILAFGLGWHLLLSAALSIGVYAGLSLVLTPRVDRTARLFAGLPDGDELAAIMEEAARDLKQVRLSAGKITDVKTHDEAAALADTGGRICEYLRRQPEKIPAAHRRHPSAGNLSKISCSFFHFPKKTAATAKPPGHSADNIAREPVFAPSPRQLSPFGDWRSFPPKTPSPKRYIIFPRFLSPPGVSKGELGLGCRLGRRWTVATGDHRPL